MAPVYHIEMSIWEGLREYYSLFGNSGVLLLARARLNGGLQEALVDIPQFQHPVHLRFRTTDVPTFRQVIRDKEYDWDLACIPRTIIDAGANIGLTSVFYSNKYPQARIVAIEPESSNFEMLRKNTSHYPNVTALNAAVWGMNGTINLIDPDLGHDGFTATDLPSESGHINGQAVRAMTIDKIMEEFRLPYVDILKIDIEGAEKEVFSSPAAWIHNVGVLVIEFHDRMRSGCSRTVYEAVKEFEFEWRKEGTVFFLRKEYVADPSLSQQVVSSRIMLERNDTKFRARAVS